MVSADPATDGYTAVFFMDSGRVARQMRASEFDAFLDGYVGLSDLAETDVRAVWVELGSDLLVRALVFFRIWFDEEGCADLSWNLPVEALARRGGKGPDLGAGPIRLVCRSLCPEPQYAGELWDPDMRPGHNDFHAIRRAVEANSLRFRKVETVDESQIPVLRAEEPKADEDRENRQRARLAQLIREQRLRIKTLQTVHRDAMADLQREHRLELQALRNRYSELEQAYQRQRVENEQLRARLSETHARCLAMEEELQQAVDAGRREDSQASAELVLLREQLQRRQRELELRDERITALEKELRELKEQEPAEDSLLGYLKQQAVFLVAFQPGVGHITLPYDDIGTYFRNPMAYAAAHCGLNEPAYRDWLDHYENPVCRHEDETGKRCGAPVLRVSQPAEFRRGTDDRCEKHRPRD